MRDAEVYPVSFFSRTFDLSHKILKDLNRLEADQVEVLREQMEAHQALINNLPPSAPKEHPELEHIRKEEAIVGSLVDEIAKAPEVAEEPELAEEPEVIKEPEAVKSPVPVPPPVPPVPQAKPSGSVYDMIERKNLSDFRKAFSLNDWFYFRRELFGGDEAKMSKVVSDLNTIQTYDESIAYLNDKLNLNPDDAIAAEFYQLLEKRFA